jgi:molybdate transport system substrate-binding protein
MKIKVLLGFWVLSVVSLHIKAETTHVAVASNFSHTMRALVQAFSKVSEHKVLFSYGASGKFYAQIKQGAPYDLFFSADQIKPSALKNEGLIVAGSQFTYAIGRLVLFSGQADLTGNIETQLKQGLYNKLAIANPKLAPYGAAALQVLAHLGVKVAAQSKFVQGENVAQIYQFVSTGNADLGFVALSQVIGQVADINQLNTENYWVVPQVMHQPVKQDVVMLKRGAKNNAAVTFISFIRSPKAQAIIAQQGYITQYTSPKELAL